MDPIGWLDRSLPAKDLELLSFVLQGISYGRVEQIRVSYLDLLKRFEILGVKSNGEGLYDWLASHDLGSKEFSLAMRGWKHRLNVASDLKQVLSILKENIVGPQKSIAAFFYEASASSFEERILAFCAIFENTKPKASTKWRGTGAQWFAPSPADGGTSKRLMMWLRWMIRDDGLDLGLWNKLLGNSQSFSGADLFIPVDTHIFKFAREWNLVTHKSPTWASVKSITEALRLVDPKDPIRFDFAICHAGKLAARL